MFAASRLLNLCGRQPVKFVPFYAAVRGYIGSDYSGAQTPTNLARRHRWDRCSAKRSATSERVAQGTQANSTAKVFIRVVRNQEVGGSNPLAPTNPFATSNLWTVRPLGAKPGGQWFKL